MIIKNLEKKDFKKVIKLTIEGMNLNTFSNNKFEVKWYAKFFFYEELLNATHILATYENKKFYGVLIANMDGFPKVYKSIFKKIFVNLTYKFLKLKDNKSPDYYTKTNTKMLNEYKESNKIDGLITFLVSDTQYQKGIGTFLLNSFEELVHQKRICVFTDDKSTYKFYEHRGFVLINSKSVELQNSLLNFSKHKTKINLMLYSKEI